MNRKKPFDLIIIGAGPTGILCGIEAERAGLDFLLIEKGVLVNSLYHFPDTMTFFSTSENLEIAGVPFISHEEKPTRDEALEYYRRLVKKFDLPIHYYETVQNVYDREGIYRVQTSESTYSARGVVVATGYFDKPNMMNVPGEERDKVDHYYHNPHPYIGQDLLVVGAANSACDAALECWQKGANVSMCIRGDHINERVKYWIKPNIENRIAEGSIRAYFRTRVREIEKDRVVLENDSEGRFEIANDFVLAMTGYHPDYQFLKTLGIEVEESEAGEPTCDPESLETNVERTYVAGVIQCGLKTHRLFIENTRDHGEKIVRHFKEHYA